MLFQYALIETGEEHPRVAAEKVTIREYV